MKRDQRTTWRTSVVLGTAAAAVLAVTMLAPSADAIANGTPAAHGQFGFAVKLTMTGIPRPDGTRYDSACSAALIAPQWIVTAGHCFHDVNRNPVSGAVPYPTTATVGKADLSEAGGHVVAVTRVVQASSGDVALAKLAVAVRDVGPLAVGTGAPVVGELVTLAGWGATDSVNPTPSSHLNYGVFRIARIASTTALVDGYAPRADTSACMYDSGAPYFAVPAGGAPKLVSVESGGPDCPHTGDETTSRTDRLAGWIKATAR